MYVRSSYVCVYMCELPTYICMYVYDTALKFIESFPYHELKLVLSKWKPFSCCPVSMFVHCAFMCVHMYICMCVYVRMCV